MKTILASVLLISAAFLAGCTTPQKLVKLQLALDELGVEELQIPGRVTHTSYIRQVRADRVRSTLEHTNPWLTRPAVLKLNRPLRTGDPAEEPAK